MNGRRRVSLPACGPARRGGGFTLIEILMAITACAFILTAVYGVFTRAVRLRDDAMERTREARLRARAASVVRNDLRNAFVSGGILAASLQGSPNGNESSFPGYLRFTTTTAHDPGTDDLVIPADVQDVEYFIINDPAGGDRKAGVLVRTVDQNLLAPTRELGPQEQLLAGVASMEVSFYDGESWQDTWEVTETDQTVPMAVRVTIRQAATAGKEGRPQDRLPAPIEILVPWTTHPSIEAADPAEPEAESSGTPGGSPEGSASPPGGASGPSGSAPNSFPGGGSDAGGRSRGGERR